MKVKFSNKTLKIEFDSNEEKEILIEIIGCYLDRDSSSIIAVELSYQIINELGKKGE